MAVAAHLKPTVQPSRRLADHTKTGSSARINAAANGSSSSYTRQIGVRLSVAAPNCVTISAANSPKGTSSSSSLLQSAARAVVVSNSNKSSAPLSSALSLSSSNRELLASKSCTQKLRWKSSIISQVAPQITQSQRLVCSSSLAAHQPQTNINSHHHHQQQQLQHHLNLSAGTRINLRPGIVSSATTNSRLRQGALYARRQYPSKLSQNTSTITITTTPTTSKRQDTTVTPNCSSNYRRPQATTNRLRRQSIELSSPLTSGFSGQLARQKPGKTGAKLALTSSTSSLTLAVVKRAKPSPPVSSTVITNKYTAIRRPIANRLAQPSNSLGSSSSSRSSSISSSTSSPPNSTNCYLLNTTPTIRKSNTTTTITTTPATSIVGNRRATPRANNVACARATTVLARATKQNSGTTNLNASDDHIQLINNDNLGGNFVGHSSLAINGQENLSMQSTLGDINKSNGNAPTNIVAQNEAAVRDKLVNNSTTTTFFKQTIEQQQQRRQQQQQQPDTTIQSDNNVIVIRETPTTTTTTDKTTTTIQQENANPALAGAESAMISDNSCSTCKQSVAITNSMIQNNSMISGANIQATTTPPTTSSSTTTTNTMATKSDDTTLTHLIPISAAGSVKSQPLGLHQSINIDKQQVANNNNNNNNNLDETKSDYQCQRSENQKMIDSSPVLLKTTKLAVCNIDIPIRLEPICDYYDLEARPFARGKFAQVKRCINKDTKQCFAAKCIKKRRRLVDIRHEIFLEIDALKLSYLTEHIVKLYEVYETPTEMILVLEMANGGELQRVLDDEEVIDEMIAKRMVYQILEGLVYLHDNEIAHLDIKPQNLLLTETYPDGDVKLCDFGISRRITKDCEIREICGTPDYVAPEILRYDPISLATDMWSLGVLTYVLLSGYSPFGSENKQQTFCNITQATLDFPSEIFEKISDDAIDFIKKLIVLEPSNRLTSKQARDHHWLTQ